MSKKETIIAFAYATFGFAAAWAAIDLYLLARYGLNLHAHIPFLVPLTMAAIGAAVLAGTRANAASGRTVDRVRRKIRESSYLHPNNHPKSRIKAPNGTSD